jgi:hypothetical protein
MAALSVISSPEGSASAGTWRMGFTPATRSRSASPSHVAMSTVSTCAPTSVSAAWTGVAPEPGAP